MTQRTNKTLQAVSGLVPALCAGTAIAIAAESTAPQGISINLKPAPEFSQFTNDVRRDAVVLAVERAMPSVVNIATENVRPLRDPMQELVDQFWNPFYQRRTPEEPYSLGSGVIISEDGFILTNEHVVQRANKIQVQLATTRKVYEARLIATDPYKDLALLKVNAAPGEKFTAIQFATDDDLFLGETVLALGNPFNLGGSVSRGILSSKNRLEAKADEPLKLYNCLQTDASINPGNSGGPLVNLNGQLIGINAVILQGSQGIGFAVPVKQVNNAISQLFTPESVGQLWFGAKVSSANAPLSVTEVERGSPAAIGGLKTGDIITRVGEQIPKNYLEFNQLLRESTSATISLLVMRDDKPTNVKVQLIAEPLFFNQGLVEKRLGLTLENATPQLAQAFGQVTTNCFVVSKVEAGSPAASVNIQPGFLITGIDGQTPAGIVQFARILHAKNKGDIAHLEFVAQEQKGNFVSRYRGGIEVPIR